MKKTDKENFDMLLKYGGEPYSDRYSDALVFDSVGDAMAYQKLPPEKKKSAVKKSGILGFMLSYHNEDLVNMWMRDDSMAPEFLPGDKLTIAFKDHISNESFAAVSFKGEERAPVIRKVRFDGKWVKLIPSNNNFPPVDFPVDQIRFLGKVVCKSRSYQDHAL